MGIVDLDNVIAWEQENGQIHCTDCNTDEWTAKPLTEDDFGMRNVGVSCDSCEERIF